MKALVVVPTFSRPDYLTLCLEHIVAAQRGHDLEVWVFQDRHGRDTTAQVQDCALSRNVVALFKNAGLNIHFWERAPHNYVGNVLNHLEAYKQAYNDARQRNIPYIVHVEDDVLVAPDFFTWHEAVQERGDYFVTVGWHCIRTASAIKNSDPTQYIESALDLSSIGLCWKRDKIAKFVNHANSEYYRDHGNYMGRNFPTSAIPVGQWTEQAGLIFRVMLSELNVAAWPTLTRCAHVGVSGYHRPGGFRFEGPLEQRVKQLRAAVAKTSHIVSMSKDPFDDVQALPTVPPWSPEDLHVVQRIVPPSYPLRPRSM